jgi:FSR family fosmidomycin resistance protein-like MFS transporter
MTAPLRRLRSPAIFIFTLLAIEFLDEFVFGAREVAWPLIRNDLRLTYEQIGLLLSIPVLLGSMIEPVLGILGDVWKRRLVILGGGVIFVLGLVLIALSFNWLVLLLAFTLLFPASGAFVSLSQSTLMDSDPSRHEQNMARWAFAGSIGIVGGSFGLVGIVAFGGDWRSLFALASLFVLIVLILAWRLPYNDLHASSHVTLSEFTAGVRTFLRALRRRDVLRWLALLEFSNLMLDVLYGYIALYFVDVVGLTGNQAGLVVAIWMGTKLIGDLLLIPLLERIRGLSYLWISAVVAFVLFPAFLLIPGLTMKIIMLALLGFFSVGWYPVLRAQLYSSMPQQSGMVMAVGSVSSLIGSVIPLLIGLAAERLGLNIAIWLLLLGPLALLLGLPRLPYQSAD